MIDAINLRPGWPLLRQWSGSRRIDHPTGVHIRADATGRLAKMVNFSVARVFFGHNGRLIEHQGQYDEALSKVADVLGTVAEVPPVSAWRPWRLDSVWNYDLPAHSLVMAHSALRIPDVRKGAGLFDDGHMVSWRSARSRLVVELYNKSRQMRVPGNVLRAEVRLCGEQLRRRLGDRDWTNFGEVYSIYRNVMVEIPPIQTPKKAAGWAEAVAGESPEVRKRISILRNHAALRQRAQS